MGVRVFRKRGIDVRRLDALFPGFDRTTPGVSVLAATKRAILYQRYAGLANMEHRIPVRKDTLFNLASISKPLTATGIMLLVQQGRLALDEEIGFHFPELNRPCRGVRIRHLLSHTSGIAVRELWRYRKCERVSYGNQDIYEMFLASRPFLRYPAGTQFEYLNMGYILLAMLAERVSGQPFPLFMKETVFLPFGMRNTHICTERRPILPNRAWGYGRFKDDGSYAFQQTIYYSVGDGGVFSTVRDLYRFWKTCMSDRILKSEWRERMWSDVIRREKKNLFYGYGWQIEYEGELRKVGHSGTDEGFGNLLRFYPQFGLFVCFLSNAGYRFPQEERGAYADAIFRSVVRQE